MFIVPFSFVVPFFSSLITRPSSFWWTGKVPSADLLSGVEAAVSGLMEVRDVTRRLKKV